MRCEIQEARSYRVKSTVLGRTRFARFGRGIVVVSVMALAVVASVPACAVDALPQEVNDEEVVVAGQQVDTPPEPGTPDAAISEEYGHTAWAGYYQDGYLLSSLESPRFDRDIKRIEPTPQGNLLTDYPNGYRVTFPHDMKVDFRLSPDFTRIFGSDMEIRISRDRSPYQDVTGWLSGLPNEFIADKDYREANRITLHEDQWVRIGEHNVRLFSLTRAPAPGSSLTQNSYTYAYINTQGLTYYTFHFRSTSFEEHKGQVRQILESFEPIEPLGTAAYCLDLEPVLPRWNEETRALYESIVSSGTVKWGFFTPHAFSEKGKEKIAEIESKLDFSFPVILVYRYLGHDFPLDGMREAYEAGKVVELTYQIAGDMYGENPNFQVVDGLRDDEIRRLARQAKEFGHPFLFRLNNEMNSTWVSYSGHLLLCDPDIFRSIWVRCYEIFQEEGVDNAIWIFNPNDVSFPPCRWNSHLAYYPGNQYVHMIGLTGYNTGTYFRDVTGERWRSFDEIYDRLWDMYKDVYSKFQWIITEFACSSVGGDKEAWINDMFAGLPKYKNIKIAVWWSYFDPDPRPATQGTPARRYWLDEKPEYLEAFRQRLKGSLESMP